MAKEEVKQTPVQKQFNKAVQEQKVNESIANLTPEQRSTLCTAEINEVLKKYNCETGASHQVLIVPKENIPVPVNPEAPKEAKKIETK